MLDNRILIANIIFLSWLEANWTRFSPLYSPQLKPQDISAFSIVSFPSLKCMQRDTVSKNPMPKRQHSPVIGIADHDRLIINPLGSTPLLNSAPRLTRAATAAVTHRSFNTFLSPFTSAGGQFLPPSTAVASSHVVSNPPNPARHTPAARSVFNPAVTCGRADTDGSPPTQARDLDPFMSAA